MILYAVIFFFIFINALLLADDNKNPFADRGVFLASLYLGSSVVSAASINFVPEVISLLCLFAVTIHAAQIWAIKTFLPPHMGTLSLVFLSFMACIVNLLLSSGIVSTVWYEQALIYITGLEIAFLVGAINGTDGVFAFITRFVARLHYTLDSGSSRKVDV